VSQQVAQARPDVLVIEGGVVQVPGPVNFGFDFGFPPGTSFACMAETMILALEGRHESFTLGRDLSVEQIDEIMQMGKKHGFQLAGLRSFDRALQETEIDGIRKQAAKSA
jgi:fatty aldehyde-generating acyl-ACP reductase